MPIYRHGKRWRVIVQHNGHRRSVVTDTQAEGKQREAELYLELGAHPPAREVTVAELIAMHRRQAGHAATTDADYTSIVGKMPEWLGEWLVTAVTPHMIDTAYQRLRKEGWSAHRVRKLHNLLSPSFAAAQRWGWVNTNPTGAAKLPTAAKPIMSVPESDDVRRLLVAADSTEPIELEAKRKNGDPRTFVVPLGLGCALRIAATCGIRRGELCALQWSDIDFTAREITIQRATSSTTGQPHVIKDIKTGEKGHRTLAVDPFTLAALTAHRAAQAAKVLARQQTRGPWIFTLDGAVPWRTDFPTHAFSDIRGVLGLRHVQMKNLRHYMATELLGAGVDIRTVAGRMGNDPRVTLSRYAKFLPALDAAAADIMAGKLSG